MTDDNDIDVLMDRALAGDLAADGWEQLAACALVRPELHCRFFELFRDQAALAGLMTPLLEQTSLITLPAPPVRGLPLRRVAAAALVLAVAALGFVAGNLSGQRGPGLESGVALNPRAQKLELELDSEACLQRYLALGQKEGRVLFELPPTVIEAQRIDERSGLVDLVFVRRIVERTKSDKLVTLEHDEHGIAHGRLVATQSVLSERSY